MSMKPAITIVQVAIVICEYDWQIKDTLQLTFQLCFFDLTYFEPV